MTERLHFHFSLSCIGEGNGNPLQCSCLENPRERGVWWTAVYGVAQSRTRLKHLAAAAGQTLAAFSKDCAKGLTSFLVVFVKGRKPKYAPSLESQVLTTHSILLVTSVTSLILPTPPLPPDAGTLFTPS